MSNGPILVLDGLCRPALGDSNRVAAAESGTVLSRCQWPDQQHAKEREFWGSGGIIIVPGMTAGFAPIQLRRSGTENE